MRIVIVGLLLGLGCIAIGCSDDGVYTPVETTDEPTCEDAGPVDLSSQNPAYVCGDAGGD